MFLQSRVVNVGALLTNSMQVVFSGSAGLLRSRATGIEKQAVLVLEPQAQGGTAVATSVSEAASVMSCARNWPKEVKMWVQMFSVPPLSLVTRKLMLRGFGNVACGFVKCVW